MRADSLPVPSDIGMQLSERLDELQILRALAALMIVIHHSLSDAAALGSTGISQFAVGRLAAGVDIFFVISGFVMVYTSQKLFATPGGGRVFLAKRLTRIVPLYWIVTTVFLAATWLAPIAINSVAPDVRLIVSSYAFLPAARADGTVMPVYSLGWTLNYEMLFYVIFALAISLPRRAAVLTVAATLAAMVMAGPLLLPSSTVLQFWTQPIVLEFVFGMFIADAYLAGRKLERPLRLVVMGLAVAMLATNPGSYIGGLGDARIVAFGLPSAMIVGAAVLRRPSGSRRVPLESAGVALGDASYALYLTHPFAMRLLKEAWLHFNLASPAGIVVYIATTIAASIVLSIIVHRFVERPILAWLRGAPSAGL